MIHPPVLALGYSEAAMLIRRPGDVRIGAIITIAGQREHAVEADGVSRRLSLGFDDTEAPDPADPLHAARIRIRQRDAEAIGLRLTPPTIEDARQIIEFAFSIRMIQDAVLCQCLAGISRSTAAALLCLATWTGPGHEDYCMTRLLAVRPPAFPHGDLVRFGDDILDRGGALLEAVRRSQRG